MVGRGLQHAFWYVFFAGAALRPQFFVYLWIPCRALDMLHVPRCEVFESDRVVNQINPLARPQLAAGETLGLEDVLARLTDDQTQPVVVTAQRFPDGDSAEELRVRQRQRIPGLGIVREAQPLAAPDNALIELARRRIAEVQRINLDGQNGATDRLDKDLVGISFGLQNLPTTSCPD
jgi:hypothetical protein